jgi:hypothetical protein
LTFGNKAGTQCLPPAGLAAKAQTSFPRALAAGVGGEWIAVREVLVCTDRGDRHAGSQVEVQARQMDSGVAGWSVVVVVIMI